MLRQEAVEGLLRVGTERKGRGLRHQPQIKGRRLEQTRKRPTVRRRFEERPRRERAVLAEQPLNIGNEQCKLGKFKGTMKLTPIELPNGRGPAPAALTACKMSGDQRRVSPIQQTRWHSVMLRSDEQLPFIAPVIGKIRSRITEEMS